MSNTFVSPSMVAKEAVRQLANNCVFGKLINRAHEKEWSQTPNGYKIGSAVTIKAPVYFRVKDSATMDVVDILERSTTLTVNYRKHVAWPVTSQEMTLSIDKFSERYITPAMQALANYIDAEAMTVAKNNCCNQVGTPGSTPSAYLTFAQAAARLDEEAVPQENRSLIVDPQCHAKISDTLKGLLHQQIVGQSVTKGYSGDLAGMSLYKSQNVPTHTCGTRTASALAYVDDGAIAEGLQTITMDQAGGTGSHTITLGDIFTIDSVYACNPISGASTGSLRQFVVSGSTASWAATSGQWGAITCYPGTSPYKIYSESATETYLPYQTVYGLPADDDAVTFAGTASTQYKCNLAVHRDFMALAMVPLEMPASVSWKAQMSHEGYSVRVVRDYDVTNDQEYIRFDVLFGLQVLNPFMACRIAG